MEQGIETLVVPMPKMSAAQERAAANEVLAESLAAVGPELIVLAGYMRVLGPKAIGGLKCPIVNLHPTLLPAFPGAHGVHDALAAGVNQGLLDKKVYQPVIKKAWAGMIHHVYADGRLGCIQQTGAEPAHFTASASYTYGVGAFLLAGSEIRKMK